MPEVFHFTIRATAASGAFADRDFSITVSNTQINRLLAVGQTGAARALNAHSPWVLIPGVKGDSAAYGDRWLIWDQTSGVFWTSPDAINFTSFAPVLPDGYAYLSFLRWRDGAWWAVGNTGSALAVLTSTDGGANWTAVGAAIASPTVYSFERSEDGAAIIATDTDWHYRATDAAAWAVVRTTAQFYRFQIAHLNGLWFGPAASTASPGLARSVDGVAWFAQTNPSVLTSGFYRGSAYGNGHLIAYAYNEALAGYSTDAGLTVQASAALPAAANAADTECPIVCQQGRFVMIGDNGRTFAANTPAGPWIASNLPAPLTGQLSLAVRP